MPNHIHLILKVYNTDNGTSGSPSPTNSVISNSIAALKKLSNKECGYNLWQRSFYDHIIRFECEYKKIWQYIDQNVFKWNEDCYY